MSRDPLEKPKLRNIDPTPVIIKGRPAVILKDPLELSEQTLVMDRDSLALVFLFDGERSIRDIQRILTQSSGSLVPMEAIEGLLDKLDELNLLEGEKSQKAIAAKILEYRSSSSRPPSHAGLSYSADPDQLKKDLDSFYEASNKGNHKEGPVITDHAPKGLIAPHIDIRSGGPCFARGYRAIGNAKPSDLYIILGTGHAGVGNLFTVGGLDYETPLGKVKTDREFIRALSSELDEDVGEEEILHKSEHVIEFQTIFLKHLLGDSRDFKVVGILCSLSHVFFTDGQRFAAQKHRFDTFCEALAKTVKSYDGSVCFIASADLDHIGPRYGDNYSPSKAQALKTLNKDRELLDLLAKLDLQGFIDAISKDNDSGRVCGFSPIVTMLSCMDASEGSLLDLDYVNVDDQGSYVSFASMIFY